MGKETTNLGDLEIDGMQDSPVHKRIQTIQYATLFTLYSNTMLDYNKSLVKYHEKCSSLLYQQRALLRKNLSTEELSTLLDDDEANLFVDNILYETRIAKEQLLELQGRHDELKKIEKSIVEIRDMMIEVAFLVEKQGEQIDSIEYFAGKAIDNVDSGRLDLSRAREKKRKYRRRKIKIILIVTLIISIFIAIVILTSVTF